MKKIPEKYKENFIFDNVDYFDDNSIAGVRIGEYFYFMNTQGKFLKKIKCNHYDTGLTRYSLIDINGKWGVLDKNNKFIIPPVYDDINFSYYDCFDITIEVTINNKKGFIDLQNKFIIEPKYDSLIYDTQINNLFLAKLNKKCGVIDVNENVIIPFEYDELNIAEGFKNKTNKLIATKNGKIGVISLENEVIIPFEYKYLQYVAANTLIAQKSDDSYTFINNKNKQICKKSFAEILPSYSSKLSIYPARKDLLYGFIDKYGNTKIDFQYTDISLAIHGYYEVTKSNLQNEDSYGCINSKGDLILPCEYAKYSIEKINNNRFKVKKNNYEGIIDKNNNQISDFIFDRIEAYFTDNIKFSPAIINGKYGYIDENCEPLKIDKESLSKAPEIILDLSALNQEEQLKIHF